MKQKRKNPYQYLLDRIIKLCSEIECRHRKIMWTYPKNKLGDNWDMKQLNERVAAADQLGYEVHLESTDKGLTVMYYKKLPHIPSEWIN